MGVKAWLGLGVMLGCLAACTGPAAPAVETVRLLPNATPLVYPTLPPAWTPTYTYTPRPPTATATPTVTPSPTLTPSPSPTLLASGTPLPANAQIIGASVQGRPLVVHTFGSGPHERLIVAGIHGGNEYNTILLAHLLIEHLTQHPERVPPEITLYILPALNPDGEARSHDKYGRANANGVDLNRNWPPLWQPDWSRRGCWSQLILSGGSGPASEPETKALMAFVEAHSIEALISYHSAALGIFAGGQPPTPASLNLAEAVAAVSDYPYPPLDFGCVFTGQLIDWAADHGIAALDVELTNHRDPDFAQNLAILDVFLAWQRP